MSDDLGRDSPGVNRAVLPMEIDFEFLPEARIGLLEMGELKEELEDVLGCTVDLISKAAVERSRNPFRRNSILSAPLTVYAR